MTLGETAPRDENQVPALLATDASTGNTTVKVYANPSTHRLLVDATAGVTGPVSSTDKAVARFSGTTGAVVQNSVVLIGDTGNVTGVGSLDAISYKVGGVAGTSGSFTTVDAKTVTVVNGLITLIA